MTFPRSCQDLNLGSESRAKSVQSRCFSHPKPITTTKIHC